MKCLAKKLKKFTGILAALLIVAFVCPAQYVSASMSYMRLNTNTQAQVIQVIDGNALRVMPVGSNQAALVHLAGVVTPGLRDAQDFLTGALLGRTVELTLSAAGGNSRFDNRWTAVYISHNNVVYNRALVQRGLAWIDPDYEGHWLYDSLADDAYRAYTTNLGIWADEGFRTQNAPRRLGTGRRVVWEERVNINTASTSQINNIIPEGIGSRVVRQRHYSPFLTVRDVRFAMPELTREEFHYIWGGMKVSTNINTASEQELSQLFEVSPGDARAIIRFRDRHRFTSIYQLRDERLITNSAFLRNYHFIATYDTDDITSPYVFDVNTANMEQLVWAGLSASQANAIIDARVNGYTIKHIGELQRMPGVNLTDRRLHEISGNLRAGYTEARGIWRNFVNINAANHGELWQIGFNDYQIYRLLTRRGVMDSARDLPVNVADLNYSVTLFTNINRATAREWMSLDSSISREFADSLELAAIHQPFGSWWELRDFFEDYGYESVFHRIRRFLVLR